jgi:hypothetical protein
MWTPPFKYRFPFCFDEHRRYADAQCSGSFQTAWTGHIGACSSSSLSSAVLPFASALNCNSTQVLRCNLCIGQTVSSFFRFVDLSLYSDASCSANNTLNMRFPWFSFDSLLILFWFSFDSLLILFWFSFDSILILFWFSLFFFYSVTCLPSQLCSWFMSTVSWKWYCHTAPNA